MYYIYPQDGLFCVSSARLGPPSGRYPNLLSAIIACVLYGVDYKIINVIVAQGYEKEQL